MELIPAIDLSGGRVVRLLHGDFDRETRYADAPEDLYRRYADAGAQRLHVVDLDAARGTGSNTAIWATLTAMGSLKVQLGGGLRNPSALEAAFAAGIDRAVLGSVAVTHPQWVCDCLNAFGAQRIVLALDVRIDGDGIPRLATHGWQNQTQTSLWDAVTHFQSAGLIHVLCTDVGRDGAMSGPNLELYAEALQRHPGIAWQASGGIRHSADLRALDALGVSAAVSGRALLDGHLTMEELQPFLPAA